MTASIDHILRRAERLAADRGAFESRWREVRELVLPAAAGFGTSEAAGAPNRSAILDSSGEQANELLAAALHGMLTNPSAKWFALRARDDRLNQDEAVARWLEQATGTLYAVFASPESNFAPQLHELYLELAAFGTGGMYVADRPGRPPLFATRPLAELYLAENAEGRVDTVFRRFQLSARQALQQWGAKAGASVQAAIDAGDPDRRFEFLHAVFPRAESDDAGRGLPFASVWIAVQDRHAVRVGGYHELPFITPRWSKRPGESYGHGPGLKALADIKMLQRAMRVTIRGVEKMVDPPLLVADDGVLAPVRVSPSGINYYRAGVWNTDPIKPLVTGGRPDLGEAFMAGVRERIESAFYNHLLQSLRDPRMTATQVIQLAEETLRILGPVVGRLQAELLAPLIGRTFAILGRAGAFGPLPPALEGRELAVDYVSPVARAQRLGEVQGLARTLEVAAPLLATDPSLLDNVDADAAFRHAAGLLGVPLELLRPAAKVAEIRGARSNAAAAESAAEDAERLVAGAADAAKALPALRAGLANGAGGSAAGEARHG